MTGPADPPPRWHHRFDDFASAFSLLREAVLIGYELHTTLAARRADHA